ncbi:hypothetical protein [uncultured Sphingomonas sp.]|uniref:hypothetical protein n=1 Tax=uncultured Sphingomonas sp. TaxID=158754 RepID=UPI0030F4F4C3
MRLLGARKRDGGQRAGDDHLALPPRETEWAPELDYAFTNGTAIKVELSFDGTRLVRER